MQALPTSQQIGTRMRLHRPQLTSRPGPDRRRRRPAALLGAALLAALLLPLPVPGAVAAPGDDATDPALQQTVSAGETVSQEPAVVGSGHVDVGPRVVDGQWSVQLRDDSGDQPVWRDPASTVIQVSDAALLDAPTEPAYSFMGGQAGERWYVVPQTQNPEVVWLGWNTQDPSVTGLVDRGATMSIGPVTGPGRSWMFLQNGTFGEPLLLVDGQKPQAQDVWVDVNTHVHANWVFTEPGVYLARLTFSAQTVDGQTLSASSTLRFAVGSQTSTEEALQAPGPEDGAAAQVPGQATGAPATTGGAAESPATGSAAASPTRWYLLGAIALALLLGGGVVAARLRRKAAAERAAAIAEVRAAGRAAVGPQDAPRETTSKASSEPASEAADQDGQA